MIKLGWGLLESWLPNILKYLWVILLGVIIITCTFAYRSECNRADTAEAALEAYRIAEAKQVAVIEVKHEVAVSNDKAADTIAKSDIKRLDLNRERETKNLKDLYEARLSSTVSDFNYRLRIAAESANNLPQGDTDSSGSAESERERNAIIAACQLTTIDYNRCRAWSDNVCLTVGCE
jgi:hypothetical protein